MSAPPLILFAPGAGAPSSSAWMRRYAVLLATVGRVVPFNYDYQTAGRRRPDRLPRLMETHAQALQAARREAPDAPVVLAGKSMGGRIGCHLAVALAKDHPAQAPRALVCFGYPLRSAAGASRAEVLLALRTPVLFVQGTRDPLCALPELADVRARMQAPSALYVVEGGDHSLERGRSAAARAAQPAIDTAVRAAVRDFLSSWLAARP